MPQQYSEQELANLGQIYGKMMETPAVRSKLLGLIKEVDPNRPIPEIDAQRAIDEKLATELKARDDKMEKLEKEILMERLQRQIEERRASLKGPPYNFSGADITEVEKIVTDHGVSYEFAADHLKSKRMAIRPSSLGGRPVRQDGASDWRGDLRKKDTPIRKDFESWQNDEFSKAFNEAFGN